MTAGSAAVAVAVVAAACTALAALSGAATVPLAVHPALADGETTCSISVSAAAYPSYHDGSARRNPDGTVYPGDAVNYLFRYEARLYGQGGGGSGHGTCDSLRAGPVEARGRHSATGAMSAAGPSGGFYPLPHPSVHYGLDAAWLRTDHYFRVWWDGYDCRTVPYIRVYTCERVGLHAAESPSFSVRSDGAMASRERTAHDRWLHGGPNRGFEVRSTHDLHLVTVSTPGGAPPSGPVNAGPPEDAASAAAFAAAVRAACSGLPAGSGCVFGRTEVEPRSNAGRECLAGIVASRMPGLLLPPKGPAGGQIAGGPESPTRAEWEANPSLKRVSLSGGAWNASAPVADMIVDECARQEERVGLAVSALQVRHDPAYEHAHRSVRVERTALVPAAIAEPYVEVAVERPPILDLDGHASANADGTYYEWDLPSVHVRPSVLFGAERHGTLSFEVVRGPAPLPGIFTHACSGAPSCDVAAGDGRVHITDTPVRSANGDRLDVFRPDAGSTGNHTVGYEIRLLNVGRAVDGAEASIDAVIRVVPYIPWYSAALAYTALAGPGHTTLEKMHALVLRYEGSLEEGGEWAVYQGRRSKVSAAVADVEYGLAGQGGVPGGGTAHSAMSLRGAAGLAGTAASAPPDALASLPERARGPWGNESAPVSLVLQGAPGGGNATAVIGGAGIARILLGHDPPGPPGALETGAGAAAPGGIILNATVESRMFGGRNATRLASYEYAYPAAHVSAALNVTALESAGGERRPAAGVRVEAALVPAAGGAGWAEPVPLAAFMLGHLERTAALRVDGLPPPAPGADARAGIVTADATASSIEIDGVSYGLALVEPLRGPGGGGAAADAAARAVCPRGSAAAYDMDNGTGAVFGVPQASVECGGTGLNGALVAGGHARIRTAMCAGSEFALSEWAVRGCAPAAADAASIELAGPRAEDAAALPARPFPSAAFAAAYAGDMHNASNRAAGNGSVAGTVGIGHALAVPAADQMLGRAASGAAALGTVSGRYGEAAALDSPPPYDLAVSAGGGRAASIHVGPHAFSSPVEYEFAVGPSPGGIVTEPDAPSPYVARVRAAEWFGPIAELRIDGAPYAPSHGLGGIHLGGGGGAGEAPCRPYCEVRIAGEGGAAVEAANAWGGSASLSLGASPPDGAGAAGSAGSAAERAYGAAVSYAESSVPYLVAACIAAACAAAYGRFAASPAGYRMR